MIDVHSIYDDRKLRQAIACPTGLTPTRKCHFSGYSYSWQGGASMIVYGDNEVIAVAVFV